MSMKTVLSEELKLISLSIKEISDLESIAKCFIKSLRTEGVVAYIGGSLAKGTMVRKEGLQDIDIFVVFDYSEDILNLEEVLNRIKLPGKLKRVHGSRDYFQIECGDVLLEVIPVVKNRDPELAENVTDVSLSHVKYVGSVVKKNPAIADEIKLAKAFCQANRCYGAESYVHGFSGYSLEVLVIHFGSFVKFLKGIGRKRVIDPLKYFRNEREALSEINTSKLNSPIVLVDPTYKYRNVCAGLGLESYEKFLAVSAKFLKKPSLDCFKKKDFDVENFKAGVGKGRRFVEIDLETDRQEGDIAGTKMKKFFDFFVRELERKGQVVVGREFVYSGSGQEAKGYLIVVEKGEIEVRGPSVGLEEACEAFKGANRDWLKRGKYLFRKESVSIEGVFEKCLEVGKEMGAWGELVNLN